MEECCVTHRSPEEQKKLIQRLNRIAGQVGGVSRMVEKDAYCVDILNQVAAIQAALTGFSRELLGQHIRTCVAQDMRQGKPEKTEELVQLLGQMIK